MVDLRSRTHGPGATKGVNLVVLAYDDRLIVGDDADGAVHHLDARVHPGDRRAPGETELALVPSKEEPSDAEFENSARYTAAQLAAIAEAAGENTASLLDARGTVVGRAYGVKADLLINDGDVVVNTKTLEPTELSVSADERGLDIRTQIDMSTAAARSARGIAKTRKNQVKPEFTAYTKEEALSSEG
ncbi:hypothetical protein [Microbacterium sp. USHLN272]|jgi:hypothetical protein|uniref:hypothetical protein n=1 Tax=Microbacterium sp. USHLN272 TaxID=3081287 RepID=UPI0030159119